MILIGLDVGIKNLAVCKIQRDSNNVIENILDWKLLDCAPEKNVKKLKIEEAIELVIQTLDTIPEFFEDANVLAIETQPVGRIAACTPTRLKKNEALHFARSLYHCRKT